MDEKGMPSTEEKSEIERLKEEKKSLIEELNKHKKTDEELIESEAKYRSLVEKSHTGVYIIQDGVYVFVNDKICEITGYSRDELLGMPFAKLIDPKMIDVIVESMKRQTGKSGPAYVEFRGVRKDGKLRDAVTYSVPISYKGRPAVQGNLIDITERKRMELELKKSKEKLERTVKKRTKALLESEERLKEAQQIAHVGSWDWDVVNNRETWSQETYDIFGVDPKNFTPDYKNFIKRIHPEDRESVSKAVEAGLEKDVPVDVDYRIRLPDGSERVINSQGKIFRDKKGKPLRMAGTCHDITQRKKAEEAIAKSEEKHRLILENVDEIVYSVKLGKDLFERGEVTFVSARSTDIIGYSPDEFYGDPGLWFKSVHPDDLPILKKTTEKVISSKKRGTWVYRMRNKVTGKYHWMEDKIVPRYDASKKVIGLFGMARDITDRKVAEEEIKSLKNMHESIIDESPAIIEVVDRDLVVKSWNKYAEEYVGIKKEDIVGKKFFEVIPSLKKLGWDKIFKNVMETGEIYSVKDYKIKRTFGPHEGETWFQDVNVAPLYEDGGIAGAIVTINDITERKKAEEALTKSERKYRDIADNALVGVYQTNLKGRILYVNQALAQIFEYDSQEEMMQVGVENLYKNKERRQDLLKELKKSGRVDKFEIEILTKRGKSKHVLLSGLLQREILSGMIMDITERHDNGHH
jgi:PAS domain S-box-containing protein